MDLTKGTNVINDILKYMTLPKLIACGAVILVTVLLFFGIKFATRKIRKNLTLENDGNKLSMLTFIVNVLRIAVLIAALVIILQILGVNVGTFTTLIGLLLAVLGFAFQDSLKDIFMGIIILIDNYFKVGDAVCYENKDGIVVNFNLRTTKIQLIDDNSVLAVSNRNISQIAKLSNMNDVDVPLSYDEDVKKIYETLNEVCERIKKIDTVEDSMFKGTQGFDDSAIRYRVRFFCKPINRPDTKRAVMREIQKGLDEAGIIIPYNQLDVHTYNKK